jgi:Uma2 family endonuclease
MATKALLTIEQYEQLPDTGVRTELVDGEVIELATGTYRHNYVRDETRMALRASTPGDTVAEAEFRTSPDRVRRADVVWFRNLSLQDWDRAILPVPDLVIEIVSPSDSASELRAKVHEYLTAGVSTVWVIYVDAREAEIWNRNGPSQVAAKVLTAEGLPGLAIPIETVLPTATPRQ